jgi:alpha-L-rhamnosidase
MQFNPSARWIWSERARSPYNNYVCFRRTLELPDDPSEAIVRITADSRYELYVNGEWIGHGPPRSWPSPWPVDEYDLRGRLRAGRNVIAVLVQHYGIGTFQYIACDAGLLAELQYKVGQERLTIVTDGSWRATPHAAFATSVPRISVQQAWEEQFDARAFDPSWQALSYDDSTWPGATVVRPAGEPPHEAFELRDIPFLTREPRSPVAVVETALVRTAPYCLSVNLRELHNPNDKSANVQEGRMLAATYIHSERAQNIEVHFPNRYQDIKLNGEWVPPTDHTSQETGPGVVKARLRAGANLLVIQPPQPTHGLMFALNCWTDAPVRFSTAPDRVTDDTGILAIGPCEYHDHGFCRRAPYAVPAIPPGATLATIERIWGTGTLTEEDRASEYVRVCPPHTVTTVDVFSICTSERRVAGVSPRIDNPAALLHDTADWTTIHPPHSDLRANAGTSPDVRVLLDFGDETIGFHEFEIDAPAGTIVDNHNFEFIQHDGRRNLAEGMNNSFRYVCREGLQRYRTYVRRGFRYSYFSFRNFDRPIRVRMIRLIESTYPQARLGHFECSDAMLTRIWHVGARTVQLCSEDTYTDCPSYEQTHWVGDARNEALIDLMANGDPRLSRHSWIQVGRSLDRSPIVESEVPSGWQNILPAWTFLWMRWAEEHYRLTGDAEFAREALEVLDRNAAGIEAHINARGLFEMEAWNLFDWAPMDVPNDGIATHVSCLCVLGLRQSAELAAQFGQKQRAKRWNALADRIARGVNRHLWDEKKKAYIDSIHADGTRSTVFSQQTHTAAYISGVATGERAKRCLSIIEKPPKDFVKAGSPFFMFFVMEGYAREGRWTEMVKAIRNYWGIQIEAGATTCWETYHPGEPRLTRSHCHGWSAAPTYFLSAYVLGVQPAKPGFAEIRVAPRPGDLRWAYGRMPTPAGIVTVNWRREGKKFSIDLRLPGAIPTRLELPATGKVVVTEGKARKLSAAKGVTTLVTRGPTVKIAIG